jgi:hypothetical protein
MKITSYTKPIIMLTTGILSVCGASADTMIESYQARLSAQDHRNSSGQPLKGAAAIIRQDRANVHKFGIRDPEDQSDRFFQNAKNRETLEQLINRGRSNAGSLKAITQGTPLVNVEIYQADNGSNYVNIVVLDHGRQVVEIQSDHELVADDQIIESYTAFISDNDRFNSSGQALGNPAAIIRQDRANFHKLGMRDPQDQGDSFFKNANNRAALEQMLNSGKVSKQTKNAIMNGGVFVTISIFRKSSGGHYVNVVVN